MSVEVRIPKEITEYQEKIMFGLSVRQLICTIIAIFISIGSYMILLPRIGIDATGYAVMLLVMPILALGFLKPKGLTFEKVVILFLKHQFGNSRRKYCTKLQLDFMLEEGVNNVQKEEQGKKSIRRTVTESEYKGFETSKKERKRKCKEVKRQIKGAKRDSRQAKKRR